MDFVDDIDFIFALSRRNNRAFAQVADVVDASVASGIDFNNVDIVVLEFILEAVDFMSKNAGDGGFAGAARTNKKIGMRKFIVLDCLLENIGNLRLPYDLR